MKKTIRHCLTLIFTTLLPVCVATAQADLYIITNQDNPISQMSIKEVRKVFLGRLHLYPGTEHEPQVLDLPQTSPVYREFYERLVGISLPKLKRYRAYYLFSGKGKIPAEVADSNSLMDAVKHNIYAIGYVEDPKEEQLAQVKILFHQD